MDKKICKFCGTENEDTSEYCVTCGQKISDEVKSQENSEKEEQKVNKKTNQLIKDEVKKKSSPIKWLVIGAVLLLIFAVIPTTVSVPYQKLENYDEQYTIQESYLEQVSYNYVENYWVKEPYTFSYYESESFTDTRNVEKQLDYNIIRNECSQYVKSVPILFISEKSAKVSYRVNNLDSVGGVFKVWVGFILPNGNKIGQDISSYIYPYQSSDFVYSYNTEINSCTYDVTSVPTTTKIEYFTNYRNVLKTKTEYKDVLKSRDMTGYRTETKYRDVLKSRPAQRYVTDYNQLNVMMYQRILGWY